ncbi:MAG: UDP-N-acetylglucosamine--N-acetylmuramyl-(pentapeptide) pyrophosphoryl-undecaprenol N-acetylglucosamine transferase [Anaerolineaceae bacterium]|nr:UDP-N-acetylglucosamine--N-acetylmuramyl-(pentapeptide) pyrophosphoryl-undecaprenol N-acetylglucosamine transferase [Anaerolineaceae bacterium]
MRIMIAAGGTGGHVYPVLAIAEAAVIQRPETKLHFVGSPGGMERGLVQQSGLAFDRYDEVQAGPVHGVGLLRAAVSAVKLAFGVLQAFGLILRFRPHVILTTGGWSSLPVVLAGWVLRVPVLIYLPDIEPGLTIKVLSPFARQVAVTVADSQAFFPAGKTIVTGYPLRQAFQGATRTAGQMHFGLDPAKKTLLVFGGSLGSRAVNHALLDILPELLTDGVQVIHITGTRTWDEVEQRQQVLENPAGYFAFPYLHEDMSLALAAADLVVSRAGASVLGELPQYGLPSILIPLAYFWRYQQRNADWLAQRGAAIHLAEDRMAADLLPAIRGILNNPERLSAMQATARSLAQPDGALNAAQALARLAEGG